MYEANAQAKQIFFGKTFKIYKHINDHNLWSYFFVVVIAVVIVVVPVVVVVVHAPS